MEVEEKKIGAIFFKTRIIKNFCNYYWFFSFFFFYRYLKSGNVVGCYEKLMGSVKKSEETFLSKWSDKKRVMLRFNCAWEWFILLGWFDWCWFTWI